MSSDRFDTGKNPDSIFSRVERSVDKRIPIRWSQPTAVRPADGADITSERSLYHEQECLIITNRFNDTLPPGGA